MSSSYMTFRSLAGRGRLGDAQTTRDINTGVTTAGALTAGAAQAGLLTTIGLTATAVPVIGLAVAGITAIIAGLGIGSGCGASCTQSTQVVNTIIPYMQQNLAAAQQQMAQNGGCLSADEQAQCLANFDALWNQIVQGCTQIGGQGGSQCIADRQRGGKYDCFVTLRDPISQMPICPGSTLTPGTGLPGSSSGLSGLLLPIALIGAALLISR